MSNNVVPGDLAYIKGLPIIPGAVLPNANGKFVRVLEPYVPKYPAQWAHFGTVFWMVEGQGWKTTKYSKPGLHSTFAMPDSMLRPIRDPGDDAVDEMLVRTGLPRTRELIDQFIKENARA